MQVKDSQALMIAEWAEKRRRNISYILINEIFPPFREMRVNSMHNYCLWAAVIVGIAVRLYYLSEPMKIDESYTFLQYVKGNPFRAIYYGDNNNHLLHTILVKLVTLFIGANPTSIRLVTCIAGIACIPVTYRICQQLNQSGILASLLTSTFPFLIYQSIEARGYTLVTFLVLLQVSVGLTAIKKPSSDSFILLSVIGALGMFAIPTMLFAIPGIYFWLALQLEQDRWNIKRIITKFLIPTSLYTMIFTFILYLPSLAISGGIGAITSNRYTEALGIDEFYGRLVPETFLAFEILTEGFPQKGLLFIFLLVIIGFISYLKRKDYRSLLLLPAFITSGIILLLISQRIPFARNWIYFIPITLIAADAGFDYLTRYITKNSYKYILIVVCCFTLLFGRYLTNNNIIGSLYHQEASRLREAPIVIKFLKTNKINPNEVYDIKVGRGLDATLAFYTWFYDAPFLINGLDVPKANNPKEWLEIMKEDLQKFLKIIPRDKDNRSNSTAENAKKIYLVKDSYYNIDELTNQPVKKILHAGDVSLYE